MECNLDYETIYYGINNARKAAIDYVSRVTEHIHTPEIDDRAVIYNAKLNDDGSISMMGTDPVESYETVNVEWDDDDNEIYTYSVVDSHGNKEIRVNK
jgi:hypothetical protein